MQTFKGKYMVWRLPNAKRLKEYVSRKTKHWTQALVNGRRNYNGAKVAKFLVG